MTGGLLVFALPQCGSKPLAEGLGAHPALRCFGEPFNPDVPDSTGLRTRMPTLAQLDAFMSAVWADWPVIEHVWDPSGWPFPRHSALNGHVLLNASRVVLLSRRNVLRLAVARAFALQSAAMAADPTGPGPGSPPAPLDLEPIRWQLKQIPSALRTQRRVLFTRDRPVLDLEYEDVFGPNVDPDGRHDVLEGVFSFFGRRTRDADVDPAAVERFIETDHAALDRNEAWQAIPNLAELDEELGSDQTGWLLR